MTRFLYDQFAKDYLKELLLPLGEVETSRKVAAEVREIDVYFAPSPQPPGNTMLGLLGRFAATPALFEPFRNAATSSEIRGCIHKLFDVFADLERQIKRNNTRVSEIELPRLWILSPTASVSVLDGFRARLDEDNWGTGVYFLGDSLKTAIVAIHQLPPTEETLWLRILGKGRVQQQAIAELEALPENNPLRSKAIDLLVSLKTTLEVGQNIDREDRDLIMRLSPIYEQRLAEARQEGIQTERRITIENLLRVRFGALDEELVAIVEPMLALPPEEFTPFLLQLSREELLARFRQ
ncbi:MAG: hypothetical protein ACHBN1_32275 [Heteroscytonema crispum UTEX LB 1556]